MTPDAPARWRPARDSYLKVLRPLVEAYWAFWLEDARHIRTLRLTPAQFDVVATLGNTDGMTCSELSAATLVTKGTLTGVLDRLEAKGLVARSGVPGDRRRVLVRLTRTGHDVFRQTFPAHMAHLRPFFERALTPAEAERLRDVLLRLRDSFRGVPEQPARVTGRAPAPPRGEPPRRRSPGASPGTAGRRGARE